MKTVTMMGQLTLGVGLKDEATFANFYAGQNSQLIDLLKKTACGKGEKFIYIYGTCGLGCTHLLQSCCHEAHLRNKKAAYIPLSDLTDFNPEIFDKIENFDLICIDDIQHIAQKPNWEEAFFHAYNRIMESSCKLILTSNVAPMALDLKLPDIISRLSHGVTFQLKPLNDTEKLQVLTMRAERRGLMLTEEVGKFILNHCPRHMPTLFASLDALDKMSLATQRKLTIPFVKAVLQI